MTEKNNFFDELPFGEPITKTTDKDFVEDKNKEQEVEKTEESKPFSSMTLRQKGDNEVHLTLGWIFVVASAYLNKKEGQNFIDVTWNCCHASQLTKAAYDFLLTAIDRGTPFITIMHEAALGVEDIYSCKYDKRHNLITVHFVNGENLYDERSLSVHVEPNYGENDYDE